MRQLRIEKRDPESAFERAVIEKRPELDLAATIVLSCWQDLESCRPLGFAGSGAIPYTAIIEWARVRGLDREWTILLADVIRTLDADRFERMASERRVEEARARARTQ